MKRRYFIGIDCHCEFCEIAVVDTAGNVVQRDRRDTTIPALLEVIETVPKPRSLVIEEGPLAGWLWRNSVLPWITWSSASPGAIG